MNIQMTNTIGSRPKSLNCSIWYFLFSGRAYGTASLAIHQKTCAKKWEQQEMLKPKNQRRPLPQIQTPPQLQNSSTIQRFNETAFRQYNINSLLPCKNCGRTFKPDSLKVHLRSCKAKRVSAPVQSLYNQPVPGQAEQQTRVACRRCGRKFAEDRIQKHQSVCKGPINENPKPHPIVTPAKSKIQKTGPVPEWKKQHIDFINNIRFAKKMTEVQKKGGDIRAIAPPPQMSDPYASYVQCRYCGRKYNPEVAERHIPKCKDIINKPKPPPRSVPQRMPVRQPPVRKQPKKGQKVCFCHICGNKLTATARYCPMCGNQRK